MIQTDKVRYSVNENVDFFELLRIIVRFFSRYLKQIAGATVAGLLGGYIYFLVTPPSFTSTLIAKSSNIPSNRIYEFTDEMQLMIKQKDHERLATLLNLPVDTVKKIEAIEIILFKDLDEVEEEESVSKKGIKDINLFKKSFNIKLTVTDQNVHESFKNAFIQYINNIDYVRTQLALQKSGLENNLNSINNEIRYLEDLKLQFNQLMQSNTTRSNFFIPDLSAISGRIVELNTLKADVIKQIEFKKADITILKDFTKFKKPSYPKLIYSLIGGVIISLILTFTILLFLKANHKI